MLEGSRLSSKWLSVGGAIAGTSHYVGTAKALQEEGVSKAQRLQAVPTAVSINFRANDIEN